AGGSNHSVALDISGNVVVWGVGGAQATTGIKFVAIAARQSYTLALTVDGNIYGWGVDPGPGCDDHPDPRCIFHSTTDPWTADGFGHFMAPREAGTRYTAIAAGLGGVMPFGLIAALRDDGSVRMWDPSGKVSAAPSGVVYTQIAAGLGYCVGIDQEGHL